MDPKGKPMTPFLRISLLLSVLLPGACSHSPDLPSDPCAAGQAKEADSARVLIENPVIRGFNPDPCMIRVEEDYYIITSSFEWWPGIPIYHSRDLAHWEPVGHVLTRRSQADLRGIGNSSGIYAPSLHHHGGRFYVLYTIVSGDYFPHLATPNYIVWADDIRGPWSDPVYINSTGFDPALFFDEDGRCYYMNMLLDFHKEKVTGGITLQEFDPHAMETTSDPVLIFEGTMHGTEGPRIYKRNAWYYLVTAEGGTDWNHQVTVCRSRSLYGPYETAPNTPLMTARDCPDHPLQRAGHASWAQTPQGDWYMAYLASRPVMPQRRTVIGRETCIEKLEWEDDWPVLSGGGHLPHVRVQGPSPEEIPSGLPPVMDHFTGDSLHPMYQVLRLPFQESWLSLKRRPGHLAMRGRKPFTSRDDQSLVARRITSLYGRAETVLEFEPVHYRHLAGLLCFYDIRDFIYLNVSWDPETGKYLDIIHHSSTGSTRPFQKVPLPEKQPVYLALDMDYDKLQFSYSLDGHTWTEYGEAFDFCQLSDENMRYGFTGSMVALATQDLVNESLYAYFDYFSYQAR